MGIVSLLGDIVYEGARSITGPYLQTLGANASIIGIIAGVGEFLGYAVRLLSGYISDKTGLYWPMTIIGYGLLCSIPLLGIAKLWQIAAILIILERLGKGIRSPARDVILSHVSQRIGRGIGFGLHEALDQIGAIAGPMLFSFVFFFGYNYKDGFNLLWIPALICITVLLIARVKVPEPEKFEISEISKKELSRSFWRYSIFIFFSVSGFTNFQIISYHLKQKAVISDMEIPIFYAIAMGVDALMAIFIGNIYDKKRFKSLIIIPLLTIPIPFLAFSITSYIVFAGMILWGAVMGAHETIIRAAVADITHKKKRGVAYGIFNTIYGISWFLGSAITGYLYEISITYIIYFTILMETLSIVMFFMLKNDQN